MVCNLKRMRLRNARTVQFDKHFVIHILGNRNTFWEDYFKLQQNVRILRIIQFYGDFFRLSWHNGEILYHQFVTEHVAGQDEHQCR